MEVQYGSRWRAQAGNGVILPKSIAPGVLLLNLAKKYLGQPYVWGGDSLNEGGFDCSGLWYRVAIEAGITFPRVSQDQALAVTKIPMESMLAGDFIFFKGTYGDDPEAITHVGVLTEDAQMLDSHEPGGVQYTDITKPYWVEHFAFVGRLEGPPS